MKSHLKWFVVPCVATMFTGHAVSLRAQDEPKEKRVVNVVVTKSQDDGDAKSIREKVAKELEKSGIPDEAKAKILKSLETALSSKETAGKAAKENAEKVKTLRLERKDGKKEESKGEAAEAGSPKLLPLVTQLLRSPKGESYRIGVQCLQLSDDEGTEKNETKLGLEVKAVVDDSPAKKAGIEEGDVLLTVNASKIISIEDLSKAVQEAGKKEKDVSIELKRDDKTMTVKVTPTKMKSADIELENIQLSLPTEGFVMDSNVLHENVLNELKKLQPGIAGMPGHAAGQAFGFQVHSDNLKKEMDELKSEIAEMKKMIGDLTKALNDKK